MAERVTIKDIAARAGVSVATVSYVLNDKKGPKISSDTAELVKAVAEELHYVPSRAARSLRRKNIGCIAVAIEKDLSTLRFSRILNGIRTELARHGYYDLMLCSFATQGSYSDYIVNYLEGRADGVLYIRKDTIKIDEPSREAIAQYHIPFVALDCGEPAPYGTVDFDYCAGARLAANYLLDKAAHRLVYIRAEIEDVQERERMRGVLLAAEEHPDKQLDVEEVDFFFTEAFYRNRGRQLREKLQHILDSIADGDAVLFSWRVFTELSAEALRSRNIYAGELSLSSRIFNPCVCAVDMREDALGAAGVTALLEQIHGYLPKHEQIAPILVFPGKDPFSELARDL